MRLLPVIRLVMLGFTVVQGLDEGGNKHLGLGSYQEGVGCWHTTNNRGAFSTGCGL